VRPEGLGQSKKSTSSGYEPATFRLAAQYLNHYATASFRYKKKIKSVINSEALNTAIKYTELTFILGYTQKADESQRKKRANSYHKKSNSGDLF
jgi:Zn-finger domain-containing protein